MFQNLIYISRIKLEFIIILILSEEVEARYFLILIKKVHTLNNV